MLALDFDKTYHVDETCQAGRKKHINNDFITDFGYGRAFDLAQNKTLYHVRLFYYSSKIEYDLNGLNESINGLSSSELEFHKFGKISGLKFLKIN